MFGSVFCSDTAAYHYPYSDDYSGNSMAPKYRPNGVAGLITSGKIRLTSILL